MKLVGSKTEREFRDRLLKSRESLFHSEGLRRLRQALESCCPNMRTAYVLDWTPEQGVDIYTVLVDAEIVVSVELDRHGVEVRPIIEKESIGAYLNGLSKINQIKLAVAVDLSRKDL